MAGGCTANPGNVFVLSDVVAAADGRRYLNTKREPFQLSFVLATMPGTPRTCTGVDLCDGLQRSRTALRRLTTTRGPPRPCAPRCSCVARTRPPAPVCVCDVAPALSTAVEERSFRFDSPLPIAESPQPVSHAAASLQSCVRHRASAARTTSLLLLSRCPLACRRCRNTHLQPGSHRVSSCWLRPLRLRVPRCCRLRCQRPCKRASTGPPWLIPCTCRAVPSACWPRRDSAR